MQSNEIAHQIDDSRDPEDSLRIFLELDDLEELSEEIRVEDAKRKLNWLEEQMERQDRAWKYILEN